MQTYNTNINSADYRSTHRPQAATREQRIARLHRYLSEMAAFNWTETYKAAQAELAELEARG